MPKRVKIVLWLLALALTVSCAWVWWAFFHNRTGDAVFVVERHRGQIEEIRRIVQANPHLCNFWSASGTSIVGLARSERDDDDRRRIEILTSQAWIEHIEIECDASKSWTVSDIRLWIFDEGLTRGSPPIYAFWRAPGRSSAEGDLKRCRPVVDSDWYVCPGKWVFL